MQAQIVSPPTMLEKINNWNSPIIIVQIPGMGFYVVTSNQHPFICVAFPVHLSPNNAHMQSPYPNNHCVFIFVSSLWHIICWGKKHQGRKVPTPVGVLWKVGGFEVWPGLEEKQDEYYLEMDPKDFIGAKPSTTMNRWNNSSQPTATRWTEAQQIAGAQVKFPSLAGHKTPLLHGVRQTAPHAGQWGTMCLPFCVSFSWSLYQASLPGCCSSPLVMIRAFSMAHQIWMVS